MAEIVDFGLQKHKLKMDARYFDNTLSVVAGDTGRRIEVQLLDTNGMVQNTTGLNLRLNAIVEGKATYTDAALVDAKTGKYQLDLSNGMFLAPGDWQFQWQITDSAGKKLHSFVFTGSVGINISEGGNQATNFYLNAEELRLKTIELQTDFDKLGDQFKILIDETTGKDVISAPEIIAARKGEASLNARLTKNEQETTAQLQHITKLPKFLIRQNLTISSIFPDVTLADVQALNPNATLSDSVDWYIIQSFIKECANLKNKTIRIPEGRYYLSMGIDLSELDDSSTIDATGVIFDYIKTSEFGVRLKHNGDYWKGRRVTLSGLELRGNFLVNRGVEIDGCLEWSLMGVKIHECYRGLYLKDTYYGEITSESVVQDCFYGVVTHEAGEVNTILFQNLKVNFATDKAKFPDKSDRDTRGFYFNGTNFTLKLDGPIVEGYENAVYVNGGDTMRSNLINIDSGHFENNKSSALNAVKVIDPQNKGMSNTINITGSHFHGCKKIEIATGIYNIYGNDEVEIVVNNNPSRHAILNTDENDIKLASEALPLTINKLRSSGYPINPIYNSKNDLSLVPKPVNQARSYGDNDFVSMYSALTNYTQTKHYNILSQTAKDLVFVDKDAGVVLTSSNGTFYRLKVKDDGTLITRKENLISNLAHKLDSYDLKETYLNKNYAVGTELFIRQLNKTLIKTASGWFDKNNLNFRIIGTGVQVVDEAANRGASANNSIYYNTEIKKAYLYRSSYWSWGHPDFLNTQDYNSDRAVGTLAQRPTTPTADTFGDFIYYATDNNTYYRWNGSSYVVLTV